MKFVVIMTMLAIASPVNAQSYQESYEDGWREGNKWMDWFSSLSEDEKVAAQVGQANAKLIRQDTGIPCSTLKSVNLIQVCKSSETFSLRRFAKQSSETGYDKGMKDRLAKETRYNGH